MYLSILFTFFVVFILFNIWLRHQQAKLSVKAAVGWSIIWLVALFIFWQPGITDYLANRLGIGRGVDLITYLSIIVIFYLLYKIYLYLNKLNRQITLIVRNLAKYERPDKEKEQ